MVLQRPVPAKPIAVACAAGRADRRGFSTDGPLLRPARSASWRSPLVPLSREHCRLCFRQPVDWILADGHLVDSADQRIRARPRTRNLRHSVRLLPLLGVGTAGSVAAPRLFDGLYEKIQLGTKYQPGYRFAEVLENRNGIITITPDKTVYCSGMYDGAINLSPKKPDNNRIIRAYAVSALHPDPRDVLMIGVSMGAWAQVLVNHPQVRRLTIVEINPGYLHLIPKFPEVASLLENPKVEIFIDDGRRWLARNPERHFDLIVFNSLAHWVASSAHLLSQEFQELARAHLSPGGIYYFNTTGSARAQRTAALVFKDARRIFQWIAVSD